MLLIIIIIIIIIIYSSVVFKDSFLFLFFIFLNIGQWYVILMAV